LVLSAKERIRLAWFVANPEWSTVTRLCGGGRILKLAGPEQMRVCLRRKQLFGRDTGPGKRNGQRIGMVMEEREEWKGGLLWVVVYFGRWWKGTTDVEKLGLD
jgi:hypothetical protein